MKPTRHRHTHWGVPAALPPTQGRHSKEVTLRCVVDTPVTGLSRWAGCLTFQPHRFSNLIECCADPVEWIAVNSSQSLKSGMRCHASRITLRRVGLLLGLPHCHAFSMLE